MSNNINPLKLSSFLMSFISPHMIYYKNYTLLITEIPLAVTSILVHWNINREVLYIDKMY